MKYELLIFDWDGTLMDSVAKIVACTQAAAVDVGLPVPSYDEAKQIIGLGLQEAMAKLFNVVDPFVVQQIAERYRFHFFGDEPTPEGLFAGAEEMLKQFETEGYFLAVATGKSRRGLDSVLETTGFTNFFHATRCADESFSKPHPQMIVEIMEVLDVPIEKTLMIGDTEYDMLMARNAGVDRLGVTYGAHDRDHLLNNGALECIDELNQLTNWLVDKNRGF